MKLKLAKKMKRFNKIAGVAETDLVTSTVITGAISNEQREELLEQGKKEDKGDFSENIARISSIQGVTVIT